MTRHTSSPRAAIAALVQPYFDRLFGRVHEDIGRVHEDIGRVHGDIGRVHADIEVLRTGLHGRIDNLQGLSEILDRKADGETEASFRLSRQMGDLRDELLARLAEATQREVELREALDTLTLLVANSVGDINNKLDRLPAQIAESATKATEDLTEVVRAELVEVTRMLRMQGDAADQVAEVLGRTMVRLSAEVNALTDTLEPLQGRAPSVTPPHVRPKSANKGTAHGPQADDEVPTPA